MEKEQIKELRITQERKTNEPERQSFSSDNYINPMGGLFWAADYI